MAGTGQRRATRIVFFVIGLAAGAWAPLVPFARQRLGLSDGGLGLMLLCLGVGSILAMPVAGALAARFGCRVVLLIGGAAICLIFPLLALAPIAPLMGAALLAGKVAPKRGQTVGLVLSGGNVDPELFARAINAEI